MANIAFLGKYFASKNTLINPPKNMTIFECPSGTKCEKTQKYAQKYDIILLSRTSRCTSVFFTFAQIPPILFDKKRYILIKNSTFSAFCDYNQKFRSGWEGRGGINCNFWGVEGECYCNTFIITFEHLYIEVV